MTDQDTFDALVKAGRKARGAGDAARWLLGDLTVEYCNAFGIDPKPGKPAAGREGYTLSFYAEQVDVGYKSLSEYRLTAAFYPANVRDRRDLTWAHFNRARRASENELGNALELLDQAMLLKLSGDQFDAYCRGEYFAGPVEWAELPARLQEQVPPGRKVRCVLTAWSEE